MIKELDEKIKENLPTWEENMEEMEKNEQKYIDLENGKRSTV